MSNFINNLKFNHAIINKVGRNPKSPKAAEAVQQNLKSVVIAVYNNDLFKIAGLDVESKKLVEFTASKGDEALDFWLGEGWQSKVIKIERINDPDELIKIEDIA